MNLLKSKTVWYAIIIEFRLRNACRFGRNRLVNYMYDLLCLRNKNVVN